MHPAGSKSKRYGSPLLADLAARYPGKVVHLADIDLRTQGASSATRQRIMDELDALLGAFLGPDAFIMQNPVADTHSGYGAGQAPD